MGFWKNLFSCRTSKKEDNYKNVKKIKYKQTKLDINQIIENYHIVLTKIKYTDDLYNRYIIPATWMKNFENLIFK